MPSNSAPLLDRKARALCRVLYQHGWTHQRLANTFECSSSTISRVVVENKWHDALAEDEDHIDIETRIKYHLPLKHGDTNDHPVAEPSRSDITPRRIPTTPEPDDDRPGARALGARQRALVRILYKAKFKPAHLAEHFHVTVGVISSSIYYLSSRRDDVTQDSVIVPASEVERHTALLEAAHGSPVIPSSPERSRGRPRRTIHVPTSAPASAPVRTTSRPISNRRLSPESTQAPRRSSRAQASTASASSNLRPRPTAGLPGIGIDLSDALRNASIESLAPMLAREGITSLKRLRQACFLDDCVLGDLVDHDFWKRLLVRGDLKTLDFFLLRQIALAD